MKQISHFKELPMPKFKELLAKQGDNLKSLYQKESNNGKIPGIMFAEFNEKDNKMDLWFVNESKLTPKLKIICKDKFDSESILIVGLENNKLVTLTIKMEEEEKKKPNKYVLNNKP